MAVRKEAKVERKFSKWKKLIEEKSKKKKKSLKQEEFSNS